MKEEWKFWRDNRTFINKNGQIQTSSRGHYYEVSNYGNIKRDGILVEPQKEIRNNKVIRCRICSYRIHKVVWELFIGPIPKGFEIDHIDTDCSNNRLDNLRIVTHKENMNNPMTKQHIKNAQNICSKYAHRHWYKDPITNKRIYY